MREICYFLMAIIIWIAVIYFGYNLVLIILTPKDLPFGDAYYNKGIEGNFFLYCNLPSDIFQRSYLKRGDLLICQIWYDSTKQENISLHIDGILTTPSRLRSNFFTSEIGPYLFKNNTSQYFRIDLNETGRNFIEFHLYSDKLLESKPLISEFTVRTDEEIYQRQINSATIFVLLITGSFGIFPGIYYLRHLVDDESKKDKPLE